MSSSTHAFDVVRVLAAGLNQQDQCFCANRYTLGVDVQLCPEDRSQWFDNLYF